MRARSTVSPVKTARHLPSWAARLETNDANHPPQSPRSKEKIVIMRHGGLGPFRLVMRSSGFALSQLRRVHSEKEWQ